MVRTWSEEVGNAKSVIEPLLRELSPETSVVFDGSGGFGNETVEVTLSRSGGEARCIVTFEAWESARRDASDMRTAFSKIIDGMRPEAPRTVFLLTSVGLEQADPNQDLDLLRTLAAGSEAEAVAESLFRRKSAK